MVIIEMYKIIRKAILFCLDLLIFPILYLIFLVPFIIVTIYKAILLFVANKVFGRKLIPFNGLKICNFAMLRADVNKITLTANDNSKCSYKNKLLLYSPDQNKDENRLANVIGSVFTYKGEPFQLEEIRKLIFAKFFDEENIKPSNKYLNMKVKVVKFGGYVFKEKIKFVDLENQIYSVDLPDSMILDEFLADWCTRPFLPSSNGLLWEVVLINSQTIRPIAEKESYLAIKVHHCLADGYISKHITDILCGKETEYFVENNKSSVLANIYTTISAPRALLKLIRNLEEIDKHRIQIKNKYSTRLSRGSLELKKVKEIRARNKVKFECVLQSLIARAARELYLSNGLKIPQSGVLLGTLPWPKHPFKEYMTYWASGYALDGKIGEANPNKRLADIDKQLKLYQAEGLELMYMRVLGAIVDLLPPIAFNWLPDVKATGGFPAVPIGDDYELLGRKITHMNAMGGMQGDAAIYGLSLTYSGKLDYTIIANRQLISQEDLDRITKVFIPKELEKMYANK